MQPDIYEILPVDQLIKPFVRRYLYADVMEEVDTHIRPAPTACCYVGHIFRGEAWSVIDGVEGRSGSGFHLCSQVDGRDFKVCYRGRLGHIMAELAPTSMYRLFRIPASNLLDLATDCFEVLKEGRAEILAAHLSKCSTKEERLAAFNTALEQIVADALAPVKYVDPAVDLIESVEGRITIADVCDQIGTSERNLTRLFGNIVGLTPKFFARAVQLNSAIQKLASNDEEKIAALANECGYYDQSHFIKAMQQFFQKGPQDFLEGDDHMFHTFIAKSNG